MHNRLATRLIARAIAIAIAIGAAMHLSAAVGAQIEQATGDACKLLTAAQVSAVLGVAVDEGDYNIPGHTQLCVWRERGKSAGIAQNVQVHFLTARQYDLPKTGPFAKGPEGGLGDEAYWALTPGIGYTLSIKKGSTYIRVQSRPIPEGMARRSDTPADKAKWEEREKTVEKAIAAEVLKKL
jgi:hypothetical protein